MERKKYFIIEADDAEPPQRYLSAGLEFTTNRQIALRFDLLDSARDFIQTISVMMIARLLHWRFCHHSNQRGICTDMRIPFFCLFRNP